jgi:hypothetical protein
MAQRADGLSVGHQFFVTLLYDKDGYYTSVVGLCKDSVVCKAYARTQKVPGLVACSLIFEGKWNGQTPDVSPPEDMKAALAPLEKGRDDD